MNASYEVVLVDAGSVGLAALREGRKRTQDFLLVHDGAWGTTWARVGCMPSKVLIETPNAYHRRGNFEEFGIRGAGPARHRSHRLRPWPLGGLTDAKVSAATTALLGGEFAPHLGAEADVIEKNGTLRVRAGGTEATVDAVLAALSRRPNLAGLGLESLGVALDARGMPPVDPNTRQVADLPLFLAGDANGPVPLPLLHEAADEGHIAGLNAMRRADGQRNHGLMRLYAEPETGKLLGAEMCAPAAEHMAHLLALALDRGMTVRELPRLPLLPPGTGGRPAQRAARAGGATAPGRRLRPASVRLRDRRGRGAGMRMQQLRERFVLRSVGQR